MSDFSSMSRESKKDKLRRQIVSPQQPAWNAEPEEDSEAVVRRAHNRVLRHRWILVLLVLLLIGRRSGCLVLLSAQLPLFRL